jgi:hypothetical protein
VVPEACPDVGVDRQMEDRVLPLCQLLHGLRVPQLPIHEAEPPFLPQVGMVGQSPLSEVVHGSEFVPVCQGPVHDRTNNEAGSAHNEFIQREVEGGCRGLLVRPIAASIKVTFSEGRFGRHHRANGNRGLRQLSAKIVG